MSETPEKTASLDEVLGEYDSKFRFVLLASSRAEQLIRGARPRVEVTVRKPTRVAMEEMRRGLVEWDYGPAPIAEPEELAEGVELAAEGADEAAGAEPETVDAEV